MFCYLSICLSTQTHCTVTTCQGSTVDPEDTKNIKRVAGPVSQALTVEDGQIGLRFVKSVQTTGRE